MVGRVSVQNNSALLAVVYAMKAAPKDITANVRRETRAVMAPLWTKSLNARASSEQQQRVIVKTSKVRVSDQNVTLTSLSSRRRVLSGGLVPAEDGKGFEFGSHKAKQFPPVKKSGYVIYPAFAEVVPKALSLWVQTVLRGIHEALEGRRG